MHRNTKQNQKLRNELLLHGNNCALFVSAVAISAALTPVERLGYRPTFSAESNVSVSFCQLYSASIIMSPNNVSSGARRVDRYYRGFHR